MIVSTFTEQEILNELVTDFTKSVKPFAKKMARKHFAANAAAFTVGPTLVLDYFYLTSRNNNKWCVILSYTKDKRASWSCSACCVVQGGQSTNSVRYAVSDSGDMRSLVFQVFLRLQS